MPIKVFALRNPFTRERTEHEFAEGTTYQEIIDELQGGSPWTRVLCDDEPIAERRYTECPPEGSTVNVRFTPQNSPVEAGKYTTAAGVGLTILAVAAAIAFSAPLLVGMAAVMIVGGVVLIGVGVAMMFVDFEDLFPGMGGAGDIGGSSPSRGRPEIAPVLRGGRNRARAWAPLPIVFGKHYVTPDLAAPPYSTFTSRWNGDQILRQLFTVSQKNVDITEVRIGETLVNPTNFEDATYYIRDGSSTLLLYHGIRHTLDIGIELDPEGDWVTRTTQPDTSSATVQGAFPSGLLWYNEDGRDNPWTVQAYIEIAWSPTGAGTWTTLSQNWITGREPKTIRFERTITFPSEGQYDVRFRYVSATIWNGSTRVNIPDYTDSIYTYMFQWISLISRAPGLPVASETRLESCHIEMAIRATGQLNGVVDQFNCVVQSKFPIYSGSNTGPAQWTTVAATSNPAAAALWVLRSDYNAEPQPDSSIEWAAFEHWYTFCATNGLEVNGVLQDAPDLSKVMSMICRAGRASIAERDGLITVLVEEPRTTYIQHFSPRNSSGFSATKVFRKKPHALKIGFVNADRGWQQDELIVYSVGYTASGSADGWSGYWNGFSWVVTAPAKATEFETVDLPWITDPEKVEEFGVFMLAEGILRPEIFSLETDWENVVCTRGDRVKLSHDVLKIGLVSGRVKQLITSGSDTTGVVVDEPCPMAAGTDYVLAIRQVDSAEVYSVVNAETTATTLMFTTPVATASGPEEGDLFTFGELGKETLDCLVVAIEPMADLKARITLTEHAPGIYEVDTVAGIPAHDSMIMEPAELTNVMPPPPRILSLKSDGTTLLRNTDGTFTNRILLGIQAPEADWFTITGYDIEWQVQPDLSEPVDNRIGNDDDSGAAWKHMHADREQLDIEILDFTPLQTYIVRVRTKADIDSQIGLTSAWVEDTVITAGKLNPPQVVATITAAVRGVEGIEIKWGRVEDVDFDRFILKVGGANWAGGTAIFEGDSTSFLYEKVVAGSYVFRVKAVDTSGNESDLDATDTLTITAPGAVQYLNAQVITNGMNLSWMKPTTGSFPIAEYVVVRGATFETGTEIARTNSTFLSLSEADLGTYTYWLAAVDVAGNEGPASDTSADIIVLPSTRSTETLLQPTLEVATFTRNIYVRSDRQANYIGEYYLELQASVDAGVTWSAPVQGGTVDVTPDTSVLVEDHLFLHADVPNAGTEEDPQPREIHYRARRVQISGGTPEVSNWSVAVSGLTRGLVAQDYSAGSITTDKLQAAILEALFANVTEQVTIGETGLFGESGDGFWRMVLRRSSLQIQHKVGALWVTVGGIGDETGGSGTLFGHLSGIIPQGESLVADEPGYGIVPLGDTVATYSDETDLSASLVEDTGGTNLILSSLVLDDDVAAKFQTKSWAPASLANASSARYPVTIDHAKWMVSVWIRPNYVYDDVTAFNKKPIIRVSRPTSAWENYERHGRTISVQLPTQEPTEMGFAVDDSVFTDNRVNVVIRAQDLGINTFGTIKNMGQTGPGDVSSVEFSPDGVYVAMGSDKGVRVWQISDGALMYSPGTAYKCFAWSADGLYLAVGRYAISPYYGLRVLDVADGFSNVSGPDTLVIPHTSGGYGGTNWSRVNALAWTNDGAYLMVATTSGSIGVRMRKYETATWTLDSATGLSQTGRIMRVKADDSEVIMAGTSNIYRFDIATWAWKQTIAYTGVRNFRFTSDEETLIACSSTANISSLRFIDTSVDPWVERTYGEEDEEYEATSNSKYGLAIIEDLDYLIVSGPLITGSNRLQVYKLSTREYLEDVILASSAERTAGLAVFCEVDPDPDPDPDVWHIVATGENLSNGRHINWFTIVEANALDTTDYGVGAKVVDVIIGKNYSAEDLRALIPPALDQCSDYFTYTTVGSYWYLTGLHVGICAAVSESPGSWVSTQYDEIGKTVFRYPPVVLSLGGNTASDTTLAFYALWDAATSTFKLCAGRYNVGGESIRQEFDFPTVGEWSLLSLYKDGDGIWARVNEEIRLISDTVDFSGVPWFYAMLYFSYALYDHDQWYRGDNFTVAYGDAASKADNKNRLTDSFVNNLPFGQKGDVVNDIIIKARTDGNIMLLGNVHVSGDLHVTGDLSVDGAMPV